MFDFGYSELLIVAVVLLIVVGPRELPGLLRIIFDFISKIREIIKNVGQIWLKGNE